MLKIDNVGVKFGDFVALDGISCEVNEGEWLMLIGPNGAGKSTLVEAIAGGVGYTGTISLCGKNIRSFKPRELAEFVGILSQKNSVSYAYTVEEVVRLGRYAKSRSFLSGKTDTADKKIDEALALTGMSELRSKSVLTLSGGELQRTFLAQVFAQDPRLLILDEPANHLDLAYQKQIFTLVSAWLTTPGRAVISVVHDLALAKRFGTHAALISKGKRISYGRMDEVFTKASLQSVYGMDVFEWMKELGKAWN